MHIYRLIIGSISKLWVRKFMLAQKMGPNWVRILGIRKLELNHKVGDQFALTFKFNLIEWKTCQFVNGLWLVKFKMLW